ncbi:MAG TPA: methyltransferase [Gaiellaceae bacterium]|nr:methyltransferase [Gaiellaceae bacterium]
MSDAPPVISAPAALAHLGDELRASGYDQPAVLERLGTDSTLMIPGRMSVERRRLGDDRLSDLIRLFLLHEPVSAATVGAEGIEFLATDGDTVHSSVAIQPWRGVLVAHDWAGRAMAEEHVVGASGVTGLLADLTVTRRVGDALDLCTGSGALALLAVRHAERVVGVDLNPRALRLAEWTLALNGASGIELELGDLRDACAGDRFDLVTANPPFVVSPDRRWLFRDRGADVSRLVVERLPELLRPGGFGHVLCQWPLGPGESWDERPRSWLAGAACDAWILRLPTEQNVLDYAANWNATLRDADPGEFERTVDRWVEHFGEQGVDRVVLGAIVVRRRDGQCWIRTDEATGWPSEPVGEHVERLFEGQTLVASLPEERALLDLPLAPVECLRLDETRAYGAGGFRLVAAQARSALPVRPKLNRAALDLLSGLDGATPLRELPGAEEALPAIRDLVALGLVTATAGNATNP